MVENLGFVSVSFMNEPVETALFPHDHTQQWFMKRMVHRANMPLGLYKMVV